MPDSSQRAVCSVCGLPLPDGEPTSRCPHCLLHLALADDLETARPAPAGRPAQPRVRYFGDFELLEEIAQGGMGVVWKARQLTINRIVALKMIHAGHLASAEARMRFGAEIEATARLDHPHIVPLYETGEHDGVHFFTMKLLAGGDLTARRADLVLPPAEDAALGGRAMRDRQLRIAGLIGQIARAVHYAHLRGILHRDLKPSNVLLDDLGEPHVVDFGLAKMLTRESAFTFTHSVLGSPNYMAPEQAVGRSDELTTATDVYGLGAIFYELLTGRPPFQAESPVATLRKVIDEVPASPRSFHPAIDPDLETICLKCLEKSPGARYASAEALAEDLDRWRARRPILARRATPLEHAWRWCQRQPALAATLAACVLLLVAIAVGSSLAALRIHRAEQVALGALREAQVSQARGLRLTSEIGHREEGLRLLEEATRRGASEDLRRRARDEFLATLVRTDLEFLPLPALSPARDAAFNLVTPRFDRLASLVDGNTVVLQRVPSGEVLRRFTLNDTVAPRLEQFSHDGRFLGIREAGGIGVWEVESGRCAWRTNGPRRVFSFSPDRPEVAVEEWQHQATVLSLPDFAVRRTVRGSPPPDPAPAPGTVHGWSAMALSPGSRTLAVAEARNRAMEWIDLEHDQVVRRVTNRAAVVALTWSPDGSRLAAALANGRVPVFGGRGVPGFDLPSMTRVARSLAFKPDGSLLVVQGQDRVLRLIDTQAMRNAFDAPCDGGFVAFDPAGERIGPVFRGDEFGWFAMRQPAEFRQVTVANTRIEFGGCRYSPDGRVIAVGNSSAVVFCDAGGQGRLVSRSGWRVDACAFDPGDPAILAATGAGVTRWRSRDDATHGVDLHDPELVLAGRGWRGFAFNEDGSRFLAANVHSNAAFVFDRTFTNRVATLGPHEAPDLVALSADGRWAATASSTDRQVRLWDVASGACVQTLPAGTSPRLAFSRDGRWFASSGDAFALLKVGSWEPAPPLPVPGNRPLLGAAAFSPDSRLLALVCDQFSIQLIDLQGFRALGLLQSPGQVALKAIDFSPDGAQLAGTGAVGRLQIWDLRLIHQRLRELALDWDWPPEPGWAPISR